MSIQKREVQMKISLPIVLVGVLVLQSQETQAEYLVIGSLIVIAVAVLIMLKPTNNAIGLTNVENRTAQLAGVTEDGFDRIISELESLKKRVERLEKQGRESEAI